MIDKAKNKKTIKVKIYGKEYSIRSNEDPEYVEEVARYVDCKMAEVDKSGASTSPVQAAVLAAMNITDELFIERNSKSTDTEKIEERSKTLTEHITSVIESD